MMHKKKKVRHKKEKMQMKRWRVWKDRKEFRLLGEWLDVGLKRFCKFWSLILEIWTSRKVKREKMRVFFCCCGGLKEEKKISWFFFFFGETISWLFVGLLMMIHNIYRIRSLRSLKFFFSKRKRSSPKDTDLKPWGCLAVEEK